jgi:hypothetical protein
MVLTTLFAQKKKTPLAKTDTVVKKVEDVKKPEQPGKLLAAKSSKPAEVKPQLAKVVAAKKSTSFF